MPYILNFSNSNNTNTVTVPDMPPGINSIDTSLNLVGRGYPDYGRKFAENFLHLLENFSGPWPGPRSPIEGQLWYDTSDPYHKVLKVRDGTNWANASGIYQQGTDPRTDPESPANLKVGDIWVDTANLVLRIYNNNGWTTVGPMKTGGSAAGIEIENIDDNTVFTEKHNIVKVWSEGSIIAIIAAKAFTPRIGIPGFPTLVPGINLRNLGIGPSVATPILNGTAASSQSLQINGLKYASTRFLRKDDFTDRGQIITGKVFFKTPTDTLGVGNSGFGQGRDGVVINNEANTSDTRYIQFYKGGTDAIIVNNHPSGNVLFKVNNGTPTLVTSLSVKSDEVNVFDKLTVGGNILGNSNLQVSNNLTVGDNLSVGGSVSISSSTIFQSTVTINGRLLMGNSLEPTVTCDIGSPENYFKNLYVESIGSTSTSTTLYGNVVGSASYLENGISVDVTGVIQSVDPIVITGTQSNATIVTELKPEAISTQYERDVPSPEVTFLALNTATTSLEKLSYRNLELLLHPPGMITAFGNHVNVPDGWLLCDGSSKLRTAYSRLFSVIGTAYGSDDTTSFKLPNYQVSDAGGNTIYYIIKS